MGEVTVARHGVAREIERLADAVHRVNPHYRLSAGTWRGERELTSEWGGSRYTWLIDGQGDVFLPAGFRTQEGDGAALPEIYRTSPAGDDLTVALTALRLALQDQTVHPLLVAAVAGLCVRHVAGRYRGDGSGDLWLLLESGVPPGEWATSFDARRALGWFVDHAAEAGWSTKEEGGWEPLLPGDQLVCVPGAPLRVRGSFHYWSLEDTASTVPPCGAVRRLRYLKDTAGGCSPGFDAFRRLNLTWRLPPAVQHRLLVGTGTGSPADTDISSSTSASSGDPTANDPDLPNRLNSHVLHIEAAQSRTHYHPAESIGGGAPQSEFYFVLQPDAYGLHSPAGAVPRLFTFPDPSDWRRHNVTELTPGTAVFIPPGTGHRGVDAFVNVVTIPGFKPGNEIYVDRLIAQRGDGAPFNAAAA